MARSDGGYDGALEAVYGKQLAKFLHHNSLIELVPVTNMFREPEYASPLKVHKVNWYVEHWDSLRCLFLVLSLRDDGRFAIIDGSHRHAAAEARGEPKILPGIVLIDQTLEQEAELFRALNEDRRIPSRMDIFRAAWVHGDVQARGIRSTCQTAGFDVAIEGKGPNRIMAVGALEMIWSKTAARGLLDMLSIIHDAWGNDGTVQGTTHGYVLLGLMAFWIRYVDAPKYDRGELVNKLRASLPGIILGRSQGHRSRTNGLTPTLAVGKEILHTYNATLPVSRRLPEWQNHVYGPASKARKSAQDESRRTPTGAYGPRPDPKRAHPRGHH
jgi:hypothetical protein